MQKIPNKLRKFGETRFYYFLRTDNNVYLFTENQLKVAHERAKRNREDIIKRRWWDKFF